jgi:ADP-ribose pyrophosphatase
MTQQHTKIDLVEHFVDSTRVYDGALLKVRRDQVLLPDGSNAVREYIEHPGAVAIVPLLDNGEVVLERQYRYPLRREFIEIPAGKFDGTETALQTGQRELREETGYSASSWTHLALTHPGIGYSDERIEYYLARDLQRGESRLDEGEFLQVFSVPFATAVQWVLQGRITDTKTMIGLLLAEKYLQGRWTVNPAQGQQP